MYAILVVFYSSDGGIRVRREKVDCNHGYSAQSPNGGRQVSMQLVWSLRGQRYVLKMDQEQLQKGMMTR